MSRGAKFPCRTIMRGRETGVGVSNVADGHTRGGLAGRRFASNVNKPTPKPFGGVKHSQAVEQH